MQHGQKAAVDNYFAQRLTLMEKDHSLRRDRVYIRNATLLEKRADAILRRRRREEVESVWMEGLHGHLFPGMEFLTAKDTIDHTAVFDIIRKGAHLHLHLGATVDRAVLLNIALGHPEIHIRSSTPLTCHSMDKQSLPEFKAFPTPRAYFIGDIAHPAYIPETWIPLQEARSKCSLGMAIFDDWIFRGLSINPSEAYGSHNSINKIWRKFDDTFKVSEGLLRFFPIWKRYLHEFFLSSALDGISYIEVSFNFPAMVHTDCSTPVTVFEFLQLFDDTVQQVKKQLRDQGRDGEFIGAKLIYSSLRFLTPEELEKSLDICIEMKLQFPHIIAGITLVGDENRHFSLHYYLKSLLRFKAAQQELGISIPFIFHAGETLGDGNDADNNVYDAILLGTRRIGHGFSVSKHPELVQICRDRQIAIEVCPISNEVLRLTTSMPMHPLYGMINSGLPVVIGSDDPAVFGNLGLSYDFFQIFMASEITTLFTLKTFARDSIQFSMLEDEDKSMALSLWEKRWVAFIKDLVATYVE